MDLRERFGEYQDSLLAFMDGRQAGIWTALPCTIDVVNLQAATIAATPTIQATVTTRDGTKQNVTLPQLLDVPIVYSRGGGYTMTFPVKPGNECLVVFASRNIDTWWQSGGVQSARTMRMHDLSDGFAFVGPWSRPNVLPDISETNAQFRSDDGTVMVELNQGAGVTRIVAPTQIILDCDTVVVTGVAVIQNRFAATFGLSMQGSAGVSGKVIASGDVVGGTISLQSHVHITGSSVTGPPRA